MAESYVSILKSSQEYNNLKEALEYMNDVCKSVDKIKNVVSSNITGKEAEDAKGRLLSLYTQANNYVKKIKEMIKKLEENAAKGDAVLSYWKSKEGKFYEMRYYNVDDRIVDSRYSSGVDPNGASYNDSDGKYIAKKGVVYIDSVSIDPDTGEVLVIEREVITTHESSTSGPISLITGAGSKIIATEEKKYDMNVDFDGNYSFG